VTVIQRADVDNHYGATIEPELLDFLILGVDGNADGLLDMKPSIMAIGTNGERRPVFRASPKSQPEGRFQSVKWPSPRGPVTGFVKAGFGEIGSDPNIEIARTIGKFTHTGALLKSAYLCMFRLLGYGWVFNPASEHVRGPLNKFFQDRADRGAAEDYFGIFKGSCGRMLDALPSAPDSLTDAVFLFHSMGTGIPEGLTFACSCFFKLNGKTVIVTLPSCCPTMGSVSAAAQYADGLTAYHRYLADRSLVHVAQFGQYRDGKLLLCSEPSDLRFEGTLPDRI